MADTKVTDLTEESTPVGSDLLYIVDDPSGTPTGKKATITNVVDAGLTDSVGARVYHDTNQSVADHTAVALAFNQESYDTDGIHDTVTNNSRLTCQTAGKYAIIAHVQFDADADGFRRMYIYLNDTTVIADLIVPPAPATANTVVSLSTIYDLSVSDYVELEVYHTAGNALNVEANGVRAPAFMMHKL